MKRILIAVSVLTIAIVTGSTMYSASFSRRASERKLLRVWSAPGSSVEERAEAVNRGFPRGIPVSSVIALLGTNHTELRLIGYYNRGKSPGGFFTLTYGFGRGETVLIQAQGPVNADPLGAGFYSAVGLIWGRESQSGRRGDFSPRLPHHRTCGSAYGDSWQSTWTKQHSFSATMIAARGSACRPHRSRTRPPMVVSACQVQPFPSCEAVRSLRFRLVALGTMASADSCSRPTAIAGRRSHRCRRARATGLPE
jgi:hypothetical protein